ncbi:MAG TPA: hypothetical protein DEH02_07895 [Bacteroidales bacterium]|nr:MAG: hypothetical protein A2X01_04555 [Bacteroidetes bacterium GWF2_35_48]HBX50971.1 hypothetical protein [Bacteroidales bacterium]
MLMKKSLKIVFFLLALAQGVMGWAQNLIPNGGFDEGPDWSCLMLYQCPIDSHCNIIDTVYLAGPDYWYSYGDMSVRFVYGRPFGDCWDNTIPPSMPSWIAINSYERVGVNLISSLKQGFTYCLSYYVKIDSTNATYSLLAQKPTWAYFILNHGGNVITSPTFTMQNNLHIWKKYDTTFIASANSDNFEIWGVDTILTGILFDNFELIELGTGIKKNSTTSFKKLDIYVTQHNLIIKNFEAETYRVSVSNLSGKTVYSGTIYGNQKYAIPCSSLSRSVYVVSVFSDKIYFSKKIVII